MDRNRLDVEHHHVVACEMVDRGEQRIIVQVLVIDHVVLQFVDHLAEVVHLEGKHPVRVQRLRHRPRGALNIGNMGIDVVGHDEVDLAVFGNDPVRDLFSEVVVDDLDAGIIDGRNHVGGGIDADHRADTLVRQRPQQDAVVAAELEHGCLAGIEKPLRDFGGIFPEMVPQRADRRGEIEIIPEHGVGRHLVGHLHRAALPAEMQPHWKRAFGRELLRLQERAGEANLAEIHHQSQLLAVAEGTDGVIRAGHFQRSCSSSKAAAGQPDR